MRLLLCTLPAAFVITAAAHAAPSFYWANPRPTGAPLGGVDFESNTVGYAAGDFGATLRTTDGGVSWQDLSSHTTIGPELDDVLVLSPGELLAAGAAPGLHRSTDGGVSWSDVSNPSGTPLRNLFRLDASTVYSVGDNGRIVRSTNNGSSWTLLTAPSSSNLVDQWWASTLVGYVVGPNCVRKTTDGGGTWAQIPGVQESTTFFPGDVQFLDPLDGWIFLDFDTYRTTNGGATWAKVTVPFGNSPFYQEEAVILGPQTWLVATEAEGAFIWKTTNGGTSWTNPFSQAGSRGVTDLQRLPNGTMVACTSDGDLLRSTDDGAHWSNFTTVAGPPVRANTNAIDIHASGIGFCGGYGGMWMQTTDSGRTWFTPPSNPGLGGVYAIAVRDALFALAGGSGTTAQSDVRVTTDGGATWTTRLLSGSYVGYPQGLAAFDDGTCFCATYGGTNIDFVYRSTDSGNTWQLRNNGLSASVRLFDLFFLDPQNGFVCGGDFSSPQIYRTTDGGGSWTAVSNGLLGDEIRDMHWFDLNNGLAVSSSRIQRSTNGGASWSTVTTSAGYEAIDFRDALHGVVDVFSTGAALTSDGGATWTTIPLPLSGFISDVAMTQAGFVVAGDSNDILGYDTGEGAVAAPVVAPAADARDVLAVWPNPLRAGRAADLHFRTPAAKVGFVEARLYDVGGRLVARGPVDPIDASGTLAADLDRVRPGVLFLELRGARGERMSAKVAVIR